MKYFILSLCIFLIGQKQLKAQSGGALEIRKGNVVFFQISQHMKAPAIYKMQVPLYVVGKVVSIKDSRVEIKPDYYLYTCSYSSEEWVKTSTMILEKQSYEGEIVKTETLNVSTHANYFEKLYSVRPCTEEALKVLTRDVFIPAASCPKVIAINKYKTRTR